MNPARQWHWMWDRGQQNPMTSPPVPVTALQHTTTHQLTIDGVNQMLQDNKAFRDILICKPASTIQISLHNIHILPPKANHHKNYELLNYIKSNAYDVFLLTEV